MNDKRLTFVLTLVCLMVLNLISAGWFARFDLTTDKRFTLSATTREVLGHLHAPIVVRGYFTADLPGRFALQAEYLRDILDEYRAAAGDMLTYEIVDPRRGADGKQPTPTEQEIHSVGIKPFGVQSVRADHREMKQVYMGVTVSSGDRTEAIPVVQDATGIELALTQRIIKLAQKKPPVVAMMLGNSADKMIDLNGLQGLLESRYVLEGVPPETAGMLSDRHAALVVVGGYDPLSADAVAAVRAFIAKGRGVALFAGKQRIDWEAQTAETIEHGLEPLLKELGVGLGQGLVLDKSAQMAPARRTVGYIETKEPVPYPLVPLIARFDLESPMTQGLSRLLVPFATPLMLTTDKNGPTALLVSSPDSWNETAVHDVNPARTWTPRAEGPFMLGVTVRPRVAVFGSTHLLDGRMLGKNGQTPNGYFIQNLFDWLAADDAVMRMRARHFPDRPLQPMSDEAKTAVKYANIGGPTLLFALLGVLRWRLQQRRRRQLARSYQ